LGHDCFCGSSEQLKHASPFRPGSHLNLALEKARRPSTPSFWQGLKHSWAHKGFARLERYRQLMATACPVMMATDDSDLPAHTPSTMSHVTRKMKCFENLYLAKELVITLQKMADQGL